MNVRLTGTGLLVIAAGVAVLVLVQRLRQPAAAALDALQAINPASPQNVVYKAANSITQWATGDPYDSLGTAFWRWWNPAQVALERRALSGDPAAIAELDPRTNIVTAADIEDAELGWFMQNSAGTGFASTAGGAATGIFRSRAR